MGNMDIKPIFLKVWHYTNWKKSNKMQWGISWTFSEKNHFRMCEYQWDKLIRFSLPKMQFWHWNIKSWQLNLRSDILAQIWVCWLLMAQKYLIKFQTQIITIRNWHTIYWDTELIFTIFYAKIMFPNVC